MTMGSNSSESKGNPLNNIETLNELSGSAARPSLSTDLLNSSRNERTLRITWGAAFCAWRRNASRTEDFPVLFFPVISVTRPNRGIDTSAIPRYPSIERSGKCNCATGQSVAHGVLLLLRHLSVRSSVYQCPNSSPPSYAASRVADLAVGWGEEVGVGQIVLVAKMPHSEFVRREHVASDQTFPTSGPTKPPPAIQSRNRR